MTDEQIIKALECCTSGTTSECCNKCPFSPEDICDKDGNALEKYALALINRQKAEIEKYQKHIDNDIIYVKAVKAEAVKEFADKLKANILHKSYPLKLSAVGEIDNLVKEFTGGADGNQSLQEKLP